jgi:hypothetical protein
MAHLLSFIDTRPQFEVPNPSDPPEHSLPPTKSINASSNGVLVLLQMGLDERWDAA